MDPAWLETMIKKHEREKRVSRVVSLHSVPAVAKGDNYCSDILRTNVDVILGSGRKTTRTVIAKCLPTSEAHKKFLNEYSVFKREISIYTNVLNKMEELMEERKDQESKLWCELIGYQCYDTIILEDLKEQNFQVASRRDMLDLDHVLITVAALGRFHAMSKILFTEYKITKDDFTPYFFYESENAIKMAFNSSFEVLADVMRSDWPAEWADIADKLTNATGKIVERVIEMAKHDETRFNVVNHGDCWTNNIMFKYNSDKHPIAVKLIDFQMTHYNSFAWDLTYFLYNSVKHELRQKEWTKILQTYYDSLKNTLLWYGYPSDKIPSFDHVVEEMERLRFFGILILSSIHAITTADTTDALNLEKTLEDPTNPKAGINTWIYKNQNYQNNVKGDFKEAARLGLI